MCKVEEEQKCIFILVYISFVGYNSQGHAMTVVTCVVTAVVVQRTCRGGTGIARIDIYICYADSLPAEHQGRPI